MKKRIFLLISFSVFTGFLFFSCGPDTKTIRRMQVIEEHVDNPTTVAELTDAITKYQRRIEDVLNADTRIGMWYKILAIRYLDTGMYGKALENFRTAIEYYPTNQNLYYYVGVCAGYMAKASLDYDATGASSERGRYLALAESAYLRALELEPRYARSLYGLSILYVFELNEPAKAIPLMERFMEIETKDYDAMFVLARAYYMTGEIEKATAIYDKILSTTKDEKRRAEAEENKALVLQEGYGQN
jgi:tetratricopeptide (TPR) repeat protein